VADIVHWVDWAVGAGCSQHGTTLGENEKLPQPDTLAHCVAHSAAVVPPA